MRKPPVPQFLLPSNSIIASSWGCYIRVGGCSGGTRDRNMPLAFFFLFLGRKTAFEEAGAFSPVLIPSLLRTQISWWNWAMLRLRLPRGNPRVSWSFSRQELLAGLPAGVRGWPPARAAMPTLPKGQASPARPACVGTNPGCAGCGCSAGLAGRVGGVGPLSLALRVLCGVMPCLGMGGHPHFCLSPCPPQLRTWSLWYPTGTWQGMLSAPTPALQGRQRGRGG